MKRRLSLEHRLKISLALKGRKLSKEHCENISMCMKGQQRMVGKKQTEYQKKRVSEINSIKQKGSGNSNWKGGFRTSNPRESLKQWRRNNRDNVRIHAYRRRKGKFTLETAQRVYEDNIKKYGELTCYLCEKPIKFGNDNIEHKLPIFRGGTGDYENLAISCKPCNSSKHTKTVEEFKNGGVLSNSNF